MKNSSIIFLTTQRSLAISLSMSAEYAANWPHITMIPAFLPQAFRGHPP
jgi:hypothetical protein